MRLPFKDRLLALRQESPYVFGLSFVFVLISYLVSLNFFSDVIEKISPDTCPPVVNFVSMQFFAIVSVGLLVNIFNKYISYIFYFQRPFTYYLKTTFFSVVILNGMFIYDYQGLDLIIPTFLFLVLFAVFEDALFYPRIMAKFIKMSFKTKSFKYASKFKGISHKLIREAYINARK